MYPQPRLFVQTTSLPLFPAKLTQSLRGKTPLDPQTQVSPQGSLPGTMGLGVGLLQLLVLELPSSQQKTHL